MPSAFANFSDKPKQRSRYTIRALMVFVAICAVLCGYCTDRVKRAKAGWLTEQPIIERIEAAGGFVECNRWSTVKDMIVFMRKSHFERTALKSVLNRKYLDRVTEVTFLNSNISAEKLDTLGWEGLPELNRICFHGCANMDNAVVSRVAELKNLRSVDFIGTECTFDVYWQLKSQAPQIKVFYHQNRNIELHTRSYTVPD
jgi:hypothetical protein